MESGMNLRQDINFQGLFKKLGHDLEEIRVRALDNLLSKLEHKLVCDADLINERHLMIRLLEWFNFPNNVKHKEVVFLLQRLSQHSAAAEILQDIGAVEFLSQLRQNISPSLQSVIDQVLENTMRLPSVKPGSHDRECIYHGQTDTAELPPLPGATNSSLPSQCGSLTPTAGPVAMETPHIISNQDAGVGYFQQQQNTLTAAQQQQEVDGQSSSESFRMTIFPWLALTPTDRHVIQSTNTSLQSRESHLLASSCEFLSDVVFQDFPAEIFLQRPNIIKNLLSILGSPNNCDTKLTMSASRTLGDLAACLRARMRYYQDPTLCTPKQEFSSSSNSPFSASPSTESNHSVPTEPRPSAVGWNDTRHRGDGRDGDSSTSSSSSHTSSIGLGPDVTANREETDIEDTQTLQYIQLTIPQFCALVLERALPLLKTGEENVIIHLLYLLNEGFNVMSTVVTPTVWEDTSQPAREMAERLAGCFDIIADLMNYHHHSYSNHDDNKGGLHQHRLAYIGISGFLAKFINLLLPLKLVGSVLPEGLVKAINVLVFDESLSHSYPEIQICMLSVLQQVDKDRYQLYVDTAKVAQSMHKSCKFLMLCQEEAYKGSSDLASLAEASLLSLPYHLHLSLVTEFVKLTSSVCARTTQDSDLQLRCREVLVKHLSYPLAPIRHQVYSVVLQVIKGALSVDEASEPNSRTCFLSRFMLDPLVLHEVIVYGLNDKDVKVAKTASDLILHLNESQLLMAEELWTEYKNSVLRSLPVLQSYCEYESKLGKSILSMLDPQRSTGEGSLPHLEKLRGTLRQMFCSDIRTRAEALKRVAWFLSNEKDSTNKLPVFSDLDVTNLTNIFTVETPRSVDEDMGRSVFQIDGLRKVYEIFNSSTVDPGVKKSAVDQLAIILQDHNLHSAFKLDGGLEKIIEHLQHGIIKAGSPNKNVYLPYLPACAAILRYLIHYDYSLRHKLARDTEIYMCLVRVAFLNQKDDRTCYEVAHILTLLLFDEVAKFDLGNTQSPVVTFSVPHILKKRYRLPFRPVCHDETSPHQLSLPPDPDPLQSGAPAEMLKVVWNVAWHGGMDKLLEFIKKNKSKQEKFTEFSAKLQLSCTDREILKISHLKQGLQQTVHQISNAVSHKSVSSSLRKMLMYIVAGHGQKGTEDIFTLDWFTNIGRFLKVTPASTPDESLLQEVLRFICLGLRLTNYVPDNTLQWLGETLYQPSGPLIGLLHRASVKGETRDVPENVNIKRTLDKELLSFIATYNSKLPYLLCRRMKIQQLRGDLCHQLIQRLNVTDAPHFYNLASLEGTLQCLMHITARPGWSRESTDLEVDNLCTQVLNCLLEVISAFHIGRGGTSMSYMGKGVTKAATLCLRHLAHEMATLSENKNWAKQWSYSHQKADTTVDSGFNWMLTLWAYRDPEVRAAGLGIAVALTSTEPGRIVITSHCKHIPGGIWGAAFSILLDQAECSMVRQQAALLLVNLTSQTMPCGSVELEQNVWQGPIVTDTEFEVSLVGLTALLALLHHSNFYQEMLILLSNFFAQPTVQPVSVIEAPHGHLSSTSSDSTISTIAEFTADSHQNSSLIQQQGKVIRDRLMQQGQQTLQSTSSSNKTQQSSDPQADSSSNTETGDHYEYHSIATPSLVSAMCQLLRNLAILAPQDTFTCLKRDSFIPVLMSMVDTGLLEAYMVEMEEHSSSDQLELVFCDLLTMYSSILNLLRACALYDTPIRQEILSSEVFMRTTASLLTIRFEGSADVDHCCQQLWESVFSFHTSLLQLQGGSALHSFTSAVQGLWTSLAETIQTILEKRLYYNRDLYYSCLIFLGVIFSEEGKLQGRQPQLAEESATVTSLLNSPLVPDAEDKDKITSGSQICKVLISVYDHACLKSTEQKSIERVHAVTALRTLLAVSSSAKNTALELGLVETVIEHVKSTHTKLNMETLQPGKPTARRKDDPLLQDLTFSFDLLRNFIFQNLEAKMACYYSGLHNVIHKLWAWCQLDTNLMTSSLALLATYVAHCPTATSSLAYTNTSGPPVGGKSSQQLSNNSMVHCLIRLTGREGLKDTQLKTIFSLLATLTLSSECRNVLFKSNFLREFSDLNPRKSKKSKRKQNMEIFWLELLVNLSFSVEGQQMILKTEDAIELLLDFTECCQGRTQECAVLIVRNLCCHTSNKPKLLSNDKLLPRLLECLGNENEKIQVAAASALWALVFNNQKAKVVMKNANLVPKLQEMIHNFNNQSKTENTEKCIEDLQCVITAVME